MNEAKQILNELKNGNDEIKIRYIECIDSNNFLFILCPNPDFQPDNGLNPYLACTIEEMIEEFKNAN